jgi:hypothetical protein
VADGTTATADESGGGDATGLRSGRSIAGEQAATVRASRVPRTYEVVVRVRRLPAAAAMRFTRAC